MKSNYFESLQLILFSVTALYYFWWGTKNVHYKRSKSTSISSGNERCIFDFVASICCCLHYSHVCFQKVIYYLTPSCLLWSYAYSDYFWVFYFIFNIFWIENSLIGPMLLMIPTLSVKISVCTNPILYIILNRQVRQEIILLEFQILKGPNA